VFLERKLRSRKHQRDQRRRDAAFDRELVKGLVSEMGNDPNYEGFKL